MIKFKKTLLFFLGTWLLATPAQGVMFALSTEKLTEESSLVIKGEVEKVDTYWASDKNAIVSWASVRVLEVVKGAVSSQTIAVEFPGGEVDGVGYKESDVAPLETGEKVLLFLKQEISRRDGSAIYVMVGAGQGKYTIDENGIARKQGFSVINGDGVIDNDMAVGRLVGKIRKAK